MTGRAVHNVHFYEGSRMLLKMMDRGISIDLGEYESVKRDSIRRKILRIEKSSPKDLETINKLRYFKHLLAI